MTEHTDATDDPSDELFAEYLRRVDRGDSVDPEEFVDSESDDEILDLIRASQQVEDMAGPLEEETNPSDETLSYVPSRALVEYLSSTEFDHFEPIQFGDYHLLEVVGRGGMGIVFRARQRSPDRTVAVKMILAGPLASDDDIQRFQSEVQAAGNLDHPNIVTIYQAGRENGRHFFSMEYVEGIELGELARREKLDDIRIAQITAKIADAIHFAHGEGILHRDLKPANILIGDDDQPVITDFGLAKLQESETNLTETGETLGTPSYMSPEQAKGQTKQLSEASDVYSLGAIMYYMMVGEPPFRGESVVDTIMDVLDKVPVPPTKRSPGRSRELEAICLKCLAKDPARRYATAAELADDLRRFSVGEPTLARPPGPLRRAARWVMEIPLIARLAGRRSHSANWLHRTASWVILLLPLVTFGLWAAWRWDYHSRLPSRIQIYAAPRGGSSYSTSDVLKELIVKHADCEVEVVRTAGSGDNVEQLNTVSWRDGRGHLAIVQQEALPNDSSVRPIAPLFREFVFFFARGNKALSVKDLQPPIALGHVKSGMYLTSSAVIDALKLRHLDVSDETNQAHASLAIKDNRYNSVILTTGHTSPIISELLQANFRFVLLSADELKSLDEWPTGNLPYSAAFFSTGQRANSATRTYRTITTTTYLAGRRNCQNALVSKTLELLYRYHDEFKAPPVFGRGQAVSQHKRIPIPYHKEAQRFFDAPPE